MSPGLPLRLGPRQDEGTEINLCMRLVHYVIMQGLGVTRDWNSGAHENASFVSCVHLRNMSHVSLGCLSCCCTRASTRRSCP